MPSTKISCQKNKHMKKTTASEAEDLNHIPEPERKSLLDVEQTTKATRALLFHLQKQPNKSSTSLFDDEIGAPIYLILSTKKFISDQKKLKPQKIVIPHAILPPSSSVCLITKDPQRTYKDLTASIPEITRVIGISKLKAGKWKSYEQRRQLRDTHDLFLADDRVVRFLPSLLGKVFIERKKLPVPTKISKENKIEEEIKKALNSTLLMLSQGNCTSVKVGHTRLGAKEITENIEAVVQYLVSKVVTKGWEGIRSLHLKSTDSASLPLYVAEKLYSEEDILVSEDKKRHATDTETESTSNKKPRNKKNANDVKAVGKKKKNLNKAKNIDVSLKPGKLVAV